MPIINTPRAGRNQEGYMEGFIQNMFNDPRVFYKNGFGVCGTSPEEVIQFFNSVRNAHGIINDIKVHYLEIEMEMEVGIERTIRLAERVCGYLMENGFQSFYSVARLDECYLIGIAINAVSYLDGRLFHDNNTHYADIYNMANETVPEKWNLEVSEAVFFDPRKGTGNYVHGIFA